MPNLAKDLAGSGISEGALVITGQIDGGSPPAVVDDTYYIVTTAGGGYALKSIYHGAGGVWQLVYTATTMPIDQAIVPSVALAGGTDTYAAETLYFWDSGTSAFVPDSSAAAAAAAAVAAHAANTGAHAIKDTSLNIEAAADATKKAHFLASSVTGGQNRALTIQDKDVTIAGTDDIAYHAANTGAHAIKDTSLNIEAAADATKKIHFLASSVTGGQNRALTAPDKDITICDNADLTSHTGNTSNPHSVTKTQVGLGNVTDDAQIKAADATATPTASKVPIADGSGKLDGWITVPTGVAKGNGSVLSACSTLADEAYLKDAAGDFESFSKKDTPVGADVILIEDSAATKAKKYATISSIFDLSAITSKISQTISLTAATGDEYAINSNYTTNKATSGDDYGLRINQTDTLSPGTSYLAWFGVATVAKAYITNDGSATFAGNLTVTSRLSQNDTDYNTCFGYQAGLNLVSGAADNTFIGYQAGTGGTMTSASDENTGVGYKALNATTGGTYNTALGSLAGSKITSGYKNVIIGKSAFYSATSSHECVVIGYSSGYCLTTTGNYNTVVGSEALYYTKTGTNNTIIGHLAGYGAADQNHSYNVAVGDSSLYSVNTASYNVALGADALYNITTGANNVAAGYQAGRYISGGSTANTTGSNSVYIGYQAYPLADGEANEIVLGYQAVGNGANTVTLGNDSITSTYLKGNLVFPATSGTKTITTGNVAGVARALHFDIPIVAGGAADAALDYQFKVDGVMEAGLLAETDGAGTYRQPVWKIPYVTADYAAAWASPPAPSPASLANGSMFIAYNSNAGEQNSRLYVYSNSGWVSVQVA